jgi:hypothetical protein
MKFLVSLLFAALAVSAGNTRRIFGLEWTVPNPSDWSVDQENGMPVLHLVTPRGPVPGPRRPIQFALADTHDFFRVAMDADVKPLKKSLILVFAYRDAAHFDYAHLSTDTGLKQPVHNGIFHVYGGERVRISSPQGPPAFPATNHWYHVQLVYEGGSGRVDVSVDGRRVPALQAVDRSLSAGKIGLGSFDETADFRNVKFTGTFARGSESAAGK